MTETKTVKRSTETSKRIATSIRLMPGMLEEAKQYALDHKMSMNAFFEEAIKAYLAGRKDNVK